MTDFETLFSRGAVRAWVDWDALDETNCVLSGAIVSDLSELRSVETVWYRRDGHRTTWRDKYAHRATVGEEADRAPAATFGEGLDAPQLFPALATSGGGLTLLDGNHRAVATAALGHTVRVLLMVIHPPRDPLLVPDLIHEVHGESSEKEWLAMVRKIDRKFMAE